MRYGIFGDVHSNLEAFQEVIEAYKKENIDRYLSVGDIVGYGTDPHLCIEGIKRLNAKSVCGNHDRASIGLFNADYFNHAARRAVEWTRERLSEEDVNFLRSLDLVMDEGNFSVVHGSLDKPGFFYYIRDSESSYGCFQKMERDLCFVGHTHTPIIFFMEGDKVKYTLENLIKLKPKVKYIVNVGSVGQPRDGNPKAAFSIYDSDKKTIEIKRVRYDIERAKHKILDTPLPEHLGYRLSEGR
ncbi:metallophosphoesterase family protein [Candidatus Omnitrophota bacterium]